MRAGSRFRLFSASFAGDGLTGKASEKPPERVRGREGIGRSLVPPVALERTDPSFSLPDVVQWRVCVRRVRRRAGAPVSPASEGESPAPFSSLLLRAGPRVPTLPSPSHLCTPPHPALVQQAL